MSNNENLYHSIKAITKNDNEVNITSPKNITKNSLERNLNTLNEKIPGSPPICPSQTKSNHFVQSCQYHSNHTFKFRTFLGRQLNYGFEVSWYLVHTWNHSFHFLSPKK